MSRKHLHQEPRSSPSRGSGDWRWTFCVLVTAGAVLYLAHFSFIWVVGIKNGGFLLTQYPLVEERWDHPRLQFLRKREKLDQVVAPGKTEFEKIVLLRKWAHDQWPSGGDFYYPPWDAVEILDLARQHRNYGFCAQYSIVFLQACRAMGLHARYLDTGHFLVGVWSDDFDQWVVMDPTNDIHYERHGVPMRGRELCDAYWANNISGIEKVGSDGARSLITMDDAQVFAKFSVLLRTNQLSKPGVIWQNGVHRKLVHEDDYRRYPLVGRDFVGYQDSFLAWQPAGSTDSWPGRLQSNDADDFWDLNDQTIIFVAEKDARRGLVKLKFLAQNSPEFQAFHRSTDNGWQEESPVAETFWNLTSGFHTFSARVKTQSGWLGPESHVNVYYKSDWLRALFPRS